MRRLKFVILIAIFFIIVTGGIVYYIKETSFIAKINNEKIYKKDLINYVLSRYGENSLDTLINSDIINMEAKSNNITATEEEIQSEAQNAGNLKFDPNNPANKDALKERVLVKKLEKDQIDLETVKTFYDDMKVYKVSIFEMKTHEEAMNAINNINSNKIRIQDLEKIATNVSQKEVKESTNDLGIELKKDNVGKAFMHMDEDKHFVIVITGCADDNSLDFDKNRDEVINLYLDKKYDEVYVKLIKNLQSKYSIEIKK